MFSETPKAYPEATKNKCHKPRKVWVPWWPAGIRPYNSCCPAFDKYHTFLAVLAASMWLYSWRCLSCGRSFLVKCLHNTLLDLLDCQSNGWRPQVAATMAESNPKEAISLMAASLFKENFKCQYVFLSISHCFVANFTSCLQ